MEAKFRKINYWIVEEEIKYKPLALSLFDLLGIKQNIVIDVFRANNIKSFQNLTQYKVVKDLTRTDKYCIYVPELNSNSDLNQILKNDYIYPTEITYTQLNTDFDTFLFNKQYAEKTDAVSCGMANFNAVLNHEGIHLNFNLNYFDNKIIEDVLKKWEIELQGFYYSKS